jgi:hypothetical protein
LDAKEVFEATGIFELRPAFATALAGVVILSPVDGDTTVGWEDLRWKGGG